MRPFLLPLLLVALGGCILPGNLFLVEPGPCHETPQSVEAFPPLYLQSEEDIRLLQYAARSHSYVEAGRDLAEGKPYGVVVDEEDVYAAWEGSLVRFDRSLQPVTRLAGEFGGLALRNDTVWVAGKGTLRSYDEALAAKATVSFEAGTEKVSHDVLVCPPYALLLDNVVNPIYLYQVGIEDAGAPEVLQEERMDCLCHLQAQWIDAEASEWFVVESGGGRGFGYQDVHTFVIGGEKKETLRFHESSFGEWDGSNRTSSGWRILAVAPTEPPVALAAKGERHVLGRPVVLDRTLMMAETIDLGLDLPPRDHLVDLDVRGDRAAVIVYDVLFLVDLENRLVLHEQAFPQDPDQGYVPVRKVAIGI